MWPSCTVLHDNQDSHVRTALYCLWVDAPVRSRKIGRGRSFQGLFSGKPFDTSCSRATVLKLALSPWHVSITVGTVLLLQKRKAFKFRFEARIGCKTFQSIPWLPIISALFSSLRSMGSQIYRLRKDTYFDKTSIWIVESYSRRVLMCTSQRAESPLNLSFWIRSSYGIYATVWNVSTSSSLKYFSACLKVVVADKTDKRGWLYPIWRNYQNHWVHMLNSQRRLH